MSSSAVHVLKKVPLFATLEDEQLVQNLAEHFSRQVCPKGHILCKEGQPQPAIFLIEQGRVRRVKGGELIDELKEGDISGMLHVFSNDPCFATLECTEDSVIWSLSASEFHNLLGLQSDNVLANHLLKFLAKEVRQHSKTIRQAKIKDSRFKVIFFDAKPYEKVHFDAANKGMFSLEYYPEKLNERTVDFAVGHDAICIFVNDTCNAKVVEELAAMGIKLIALRCAGYNNVDLPACKRHGITVVRVPAYSPYAVAEHAMGLILTLNRKLHKAYNRTREGNFSLDGLLGFDIHGKVAGIIGTGKIGCCLVDILLGFGCTVLCYDMYQSEYVKSKKNARYVELDELLTQSDIISLHVPLTPSSRYMINDESIAKMKKGVMIINTSRGALIQTSSLINGLKNRQIGAAGLDVYEEESAYFFEDHSSEVISDSVLARLLTFPNVIVTGHQAFFTTDALDNIAQTTINNIALYQFQGKKEDQHPNNVRPEY